MDSMPGMDHGDGGGSTNVTTGSTSGTSHTMSMGGMGGMEMIFTDWSSYKLTLLLSSWTITKPWQFFLTWVLVFLATILLHAFRFAISGLDCMIANTAKSNPGYKGIHDTGAVGEASAFQTSRRLVRPNGWIVLKLLHGLMMGCQYGLSLLLMLVAMSMNPSLILALCLGYAVGDILLAEHNYDLQSGSSGIVRRTYSWWMKHSYPEHVALIAGIITFPLSILITYALIDTVCLQYKNGQSLPEKAPWAGSWVSDFCDFDIEPTQKKALQISLAVFYSWLIIVGGMCLLSGSNKKVFRFMHTRLSLIGLTNGETILFFGVATLLIFNCVYWYHTFKFMLDHSELYAFWMKDSIRRPTYFATQVTGRLLDVSLGLLMLPVSKNSVLQLLFGISYTGAIGFHKLMGWFFVIVSVIHVGVYMKAASMDSMQSLESHMFNTYDPNFAAMMPGYTMKEWGIGNWMTTMGTIGTIIMVPPILLSFPIVRNNFYNLFYFSHLLLHVGIVFLWLHAGSDLYYMLPAIGLYATDILLRIIARFSPQRVLRVTPTSGGLVRIDFDISERHSVRNYLPGQFVRVCFPTINSFEWHPYTLAMQVGATVATIYLDPKMKNVTSLPRQMAWSRAVCNRLQGEEPVSVEGPFGGLSFDPKDVNLVICLVGGSGLTVAMSVALYIDSTTSVKENEKSVDNTGEREMETSVAMVWSVNTTDDPIKLSSIFSDLSDRTTVAVHRTTNNAVTESGIVLAGAVAWGSTGGFDTGRAAVNVFDGRVNFVDYLAQYDHAGDVGIVICGPTSFTEYAITAAEDFAERSQNNVFLSIESFRS